MDQGKKAVRSELVIFTLPQSSTQPSRLGLVVSRRVGGAVVRNRVKRVIREIFRLNISPASSGVDIVVVARESASRATYSELRATLLGALSRQMKSSNADTAVSGGPAS